MSPELNAISSSLLSVAVCLFVVALVHSAMFEWCVTFELRARGRTVTATIDDLEVIPQRTQRHVVWVTFQPNGARDKQTIRFSQQVSIRGFRKFKRDQEVEVCFLPRKPSIARLAGIYAATSYRNNVTIIVFILVVIYFPLLIVAFLSTLINFAWLRWQQARKD